MYDDFRGTIRRAHASGQTAQGEKICVGECGHRIRRSWLCNRILTGPQRYAGKRFTPHEDLVCTAKLKLDPSRNTFPCLHDPCKMGGLMGIVSPNAGS